MWKGSEGQSFLGLNPASFWISFLLSPSKIMVQFSQFRLLSHVRLFVTPQTAARQASLSIPTPRACSDSCPSCWWCHPTISSSVILLFSSLQSFPASRSFPMSQFFTSGGQSNGVSASASVLPMNIQNWLPLGLTGWISLQSKGLSKVFSNTTKIWPAENWSFVIWDLTMSKRCQFNCWYTCKNIFTKG